MTPKPDKHVSVSFAPLGLGTREIIKNVKMGHLTPILPYYESYWCWPKNTRVASVVRGYITALYYNVNY